VSTATEISREVPVTTIAKSVGVRGGVSVHQGQDRSPLTPVAGTPHGGVVKYNRLDERTGGQLMA
jgi:hypothetical protein